MEARLVVVLALLGLACAAPQLRLSEKSNIALDYALAGGVPLGVYSANKVYKGYEREPGNLVILNIPGLSHTVGDLRNYDSAESVEIAASAATAGSRSGLTSSPATVNSFNSGGLGLAAVLDSRESAEDTFNIASIDRDSLEDVFDDSSEVFLGNIGGATAGVPLSAGGGVPLPAGGGVPLPAGGGVPLPAGGGASLGAAPAVGGGVPLSAAAGVVSAGRALTGGPFRTAAQFEAAEEFLDAAEDAAELQGLRQAAQAASASGNTLVAGLLMREAAEEAAEEARDRAEDIAELSATRRAAAAAAASGNMFLAQQLMAEAAEDAAEIALEAAANARVAGGAASFAQEVALNARRAAAETAADVRQLASGNAAPNTAAGGVGGGVPLPSLQSLTRKKRQSSDEEDDPFALSPIEETSFALSSLGTLLGANFGRWFDETYDANVKFFRGLETTGNIVLDQVDDMLEEEKDFGR